MEVKRLFRSNKNRAIGGVCGGLGDYFAIDPVILRILFVLGFIIFGIGVIVYLILWIMMPEEPINIQ
jgi:phage shock protein C